MGGEGTQSVAETHAVNGPQAVAVTHARPQAVALTHAVAGTQAVASTHAVAAPRPIARPATTGAVRLHGPTGEILLCAAGLALVALLMSAGHVRNGGLYYDDWSLAAVGRFPGSGGLLHALWLDYGQRPGQVLYYAALDRAFGSAASPRLALAATMVVLQATCLYALLRTLALRTRDAAAIAVLVLTFPFSDSLWLWGVLSLTSLAIAAALAGVLLALRALRSSGRRALALHCASLALYVASILSYEAFAVAGCLAGLLYTRAAGLRRARLRWAVDVVVIAVTLAVARIALPIDVATPSHVQSLGGMVDHAGLIAVGGAHILGAAVLPVGGWSPWIGAAVLAAVLVWAAIMRARIPAGEEIRPELGRWLAIAAAGALAALAAWAVYVPASDHYVPSAAGTVNRMNAAAAIGVAVLVYASAVLLVRMLGRVVRAPSSASSAAVATVALVLAGAYVARSLSDARPWDAAAVQQRLELADMHSELPALAAGSTVYVVGASPTVGPGVPVLGTTLDLTSAMRLSYSQQQLTGVPLASAHAIACGRRGPLAGAVEGIYGDSYLLDVGRRRAVRLLGRGACTAVTRHGGVT
jgi:hypothetical protein